MRNLDLERARELLAEADKPRCLGLYVSKRDEPLEALLRIREFLVLAGGDDAHALVVVCLDRVIETLGGFAKRIVYEHAPDRQLYPIWQPKQVREEQKK
jgi:hypothetical protein